MVASVCRELSGYYTWCDILAVIYSDAGLVSCRYICAGVMKVEATKLVQSVRLAILRLRRATELDSCVVLGTRS